MLFHLKEFLKERKKEMFKFICLAVLFVSRCAANRFDADQRGGEDFKL